MILSKKKYNTPLIQKLTFFLLFFFSSLSYLSLGPLVWFERRQRVKQRSRTPRALGSFGHHIHWNALRSKTASTPLGQCLAFSRISIRKSTLTGTAVNLGDLAAGLAQTTRWVALRSPDELLATSTTVHRHRALRVGIRPCMLREGSG